MQKNKWSRKFDWIKNSDGTYVQQTRSETYNENRFISVGDIYFRFNKYLTGITYSYINNLNNIYKRDLLTGDGYSIVNMYNEYDIIDYALENSIIVDVAADTNINIYNQWFSINGVKLKPGHLVLLMFQNSEFENDVYTVTDNYFLENSLFLSSREKSYRFNCGVKLGKNADKQFFLINNGYVFPTIGEPKYFIEGKSLIIKNLINYNLYNTSTSNPSKMLFTDYDFARKQLNDNYSLYDKIIFQINSITTPSGSSTIDNYFTINYHHDSYIIRLLQTNNIKYTGNTSSILSLNTTYIPYDNLLDFSIGDNIKFDIISGSTILLSTQFFIKNIISGFIILENSIPKNILSDLKHTYFEIENLNVAVDWIDALNKLSLYTPYSEYYSVDVFDDISEYPIIDVIITPKECEYNKYFDYDALVFSINNNFINYIFITSNQYISYNLYNNLSHIDSGITLETQVYNNYLLDNIQYDYTDSGRIRIITSQTGLTSVFRPYTYVNIVDSNLLSGKTLIYEVDDYNIIIEKPNSWNNILPLPSIVSIQNISNIGDISNILYEVYMNDSYDWYRRKNDNERKYISKSYAEILIENKFIRDIITGIIYENDNNEFVLKLYDLGSVINKENINFDSNLYYSPIELSYIGVDKKTRLPIPIELKNVVDTITGLTFNDLDWNVLNGGLNDILDGSDNIGYIGDYFSEGVNIVLPGPSDTPLLYNVVDGNMMVTFTTTTTTTI